MVLRIFRDGICRPSKFPKPKLNALHVQRSTSSDQPPEEVARCKECQRIIDPTLGSQRFEDPNNIKRPTLCIAHTTVFDASKDDNANTESLLESLQKKLASETGLKQNIAVDEAQKNASGEVTAGTKGQEEHYKYGLQGNNLWQYANMNNSDKNKDDKLLQRPERIEDRDKTEVVDPPHLIPSHIRYRFEADTQLDELAKKYLNMQKDQIDNRLSQEMERLGLPINPGEAMRPSINVNISCEEDTFVEVDVPKADEPPQKEVINSNQQYYEQTSWCNLYFKHSRENESEITSSERDGIDTHKGYAQSTRSEEMLPLHCCLDFDPFDKSYETNISVKKLGFEKHDDIIPFHQLQCMEFTDLDLKLNNEKIDSLNVEEGLPNHLYLQGHLIDDFATAPNTIQAIGLYDFITSFDDTELIENIPKQQVTDVFHSLMSQDMDVTKFDYAFPRDSEVAYSLSRLTKGSDTIIQIQNQTMLNEREQMDEKKQALTNMNLVRPKVVEQIDVSKKVQTATNDVRTDYQPTNPHQNPKTDAELRNLINAKVMEQICAPTQRYGRLVQSTQEPPSPELTNLIHTRVLEQVRAPPTLKRTTHSLKGIDAIVQVHPPKEAHLDPFIERKVMKDDVTYQKEEAIVKSINQDEPAAKLEQKTEQLETPQTNLLKSRDNNAKLIDTAEKAEETKNPSRGTETIVQSCVQTVPSSEAQKAAHQDVMSIPKTIDDLANNLTLDMNLSLSELLRRVRVRNRLQYLYNIKEQMNKVSTLNTEEICPPGDRPQCPPPPDCTRPCEPPSKPKCPPEPPKCPPDPPKCPPEPPKCPPEPPKCPPPKETPKCPPDPPTCPPEPKPKCPCPCPPPPKCPPGPPKCPCSTADNPEDPVTIDILDAATIYLRSIIKLIKTGFLVSKNTLLPAIKDSSSENATLNLNRIKDFEPWTPIPSWPFPVNPKKRKLQCPNHGCPFPKPGPVRPNCPELPCAGFPKRLSFSDASYIN